MENVSPNRPVLQVLKWRKTAMPLFLLHLVQTLPKLRLFSMVC